MTSFLGTETPVDPISANLVLSAAKVCSNVFTIGPYVSRVNFYSQQIRALNLVYSLEKEGPLKAATSRKTDIKIGIVGAGIAGLTAASGLARRGYKPYLYEVEDGAVPIEYKKASVNRYIHPTVNYWPGQKLDPGADLPVLFWSADSCAEVTEKIWKQWENIRKSYKLEIKPQTVEKVLIEANRGTLDFKTATNESHEVIILATGFSSEITVEGTMPGTYWTGSDEWRKLYGHKSRSDKKVAISGNGDGALIEALNLFYDKFDYGRMTDKLARVLDRVVTKNKWDELAEFEHKCSETENTHGDDAYGSGMSDFLKDIIEVQDLLTIDNCELGAIDIILSGSILSGKNCFIHRLLWFFARSRLENKIPRRIFVHENCRLKLGKELNSDKDINENSISNNTLYIVGYDSDHPSSSEQEAREGDVKAVNHDYIIARHGANPKIESLINDIDIVGRLRGKQRDLEPFVTDKIWEIEDAHYFDIARDGVDFKLELLKEKLKTISKESILVGSGVSTHFEVQKSDSGAYKIIINKAPHSWTSDTCTNYPQCLFGLEVSINPRNAEPYKRSESGVASNA